MRFEELKSTLYRNETVTPETVDAIEYHALTLSQNIHDDYNMLNSIIVRHEALIRLRWIKKNVSQRRKIMLAAWPDMPTGHRPDVSSAVFNEQVIQGLIPRDSTLPDFFV